MSTLSAATINSPGGGIGDVMGMGDIQTIIVPFKVAMGASYATGGDTWTAPSGLPGGWKLRQIGITGPVQSGHLFTWDGSTTTPKIMAHNGLSGASLTYSFAAPAVGTAGNDSTVYPLTIPTAGAITAVQYVVNTDFTGAATNARHWALNNYTQTLVPATFNGAGSGAGYNLTHGVKNAFTLGNTAAKAVTAGDVFAFVSTHDGSGLADPGGTVFVTLAPTSQQVASTTDLSAITITGFAVYGA